jgi:hypothetical protein
MAKFGLLMLSLLVFCPASAHHSRAVFDLSSTIEVEGTIREVAWRNPHAFVVVDSINADGNYTQWTFEGHSIAGLTRNGWARDSFVAGERVVVAARPNRDSETRFGLLNSITKTNGETYYAFSRPSDASSPARTPILPSTDFGGTWRPILDMQQTLVGGFRPPEDWPYTEKALEEVEAFDLNEDPGLQCVPYPMPRITRWPYSQHWDISENTIRITHEQASSRVLNKTMDLSIPPTYTPDQNGYSVAHIDDNGDLVVTTTGFSETKWGSERGVSSSANKVVTETYRLVDGGYGLELEYTITDPDYLRESVRLGRNFRLIPDYQFTNEPCNIEAARRHLQFD